MCTQVVSRKRRFCTRSELVYDDYSFCGQWRRDSFGSAFNTLPKQYSLNSSNRSSLSLSLFHTHTHTHPYRSRTRNGRIWSVCNMQMIPKRRDHFSFTVEYAKSKTNDYKVNRSTNSGHVRIGNCHCVHSVSECAVCCVCGSVCALDTIVLGLGLGLRTNFFHAHKPHTRSSRRSMWHNSHCKARLKYVGYMCGGRFVFSPVTNGHQFRSLIFSENRNKKNASQNWAVIVASTRCHSQGDYPSLSLFTAGRASLLLAEVSRYALHTHTPFVALHWR